MGKKNNYLDHRIQRANFSTEKAYRLAHSAREGLRVIYNLGWSLRNIGILPQSQLDILFEEVNKLLDSIYLI
jgi:hypothetical protein